MGDKHGIREAPVAKSAGRPATAPVVSTPTDLAAFASTALPGVDGYGGVPLPRPTREFFEPRFGFDLSGVRVHADDAADRATSTIGARAYTAGQHIAFARGSYAPGSPEGRQLLAHELAHVAQNRDASTHSRLVSEAGDAGEREAEIHAQHALAGEPRAAVVRPMARPCALVSRLPAAAKKPYAVGDFVLAKNAFALYDKLGGEKDRKLLKQVEAGDMLKVKGEPPNGAGVAFYVAPFKKGTTDEESDASGAPLIGVASTSWLKPTAAPAKVPKAPANAAMDLPKAATLMEFDLGKGDQGQITFTYTPPPQQPNYVDNATHVLWFSLLTAAFGGYVIQIDELEKGILIPTNYVDRGSKKATPVSDHVFDDREQALAAVEAAGGGDHIAYYRAAAGLIVPTVFSSATAPRIVKMINDGYKEVVDELNTILTLYAISLVGTIVGNLLVQASVGGPIGLMKGGGADEVPATKTSEKGPASKTTDNAPAAKPKPVANADPVAKPPAPQQKNPPTGPWISGNEAPKPETGVMGIPKSNITVELPPPPAKPTTPQQQVAAKQALNTGVAGAGGTQKLFDMGVGDRGLAIENIASSVYGQMGGNVQRCPPGYDFIDHYYGGTTTQDGNVKVVEGATVISDKSVDLRGASVDTAKTTETYIKSNHVNKLFKMPDTFEKMNLRMVSPQSKILNVWYGPREPTQAQMLGMKEAADHAALNGIHINYIRLP